MWNYRNIGALISSEYAMTTLSSEVDAAKLASRRSRLSIDYDLYTRSAMGITQSGVNPLVRAATLCGYKLRRQFLPHYFQSPPRWRMLLRSTATQRILPDFGVIATVKSGTTDMAATVMSHPNVLCPLVKEFDSVDPLEWRKFYPTKTAVKRHEQRYGICLSPFVGPYLHSLQTACLLYSLKPGTKIIINLRNPSDLVYSIWKWTVLHTRKEVLARTPFLTTFASYVDKSLDLFPGDSDRHFESLRRGIYWQSVAHWLSCFGDNNIRVFDISEYFTNRTAYMQQVNRFIGLPHVALPDDIPVANRNPLELAPSTAETRAKLREFFEPYNRRLWDVIGIRYEW